MRVTISLKAVSQECCPFLSSFARNTKICIWENKISDPGIAPKRPVIPYQNDRRVIRLYIFAKIRDCDDFSNPVDTSFPDHAYTALLITLCNRLG